MDSLAKRLASNHFFHLRNDENPFSSYSISLRLYIYYLLDLFLMLSFDFYRSLYLVLISETFYSFRFYFIISPRYFVSELNSCLKYISALIRKFSSKKIFIIKGYNYKAFPINYIDGFTLKCNIKSKSMQRKVTK